MARWYVGTALVAIPLGLLCLAGALVPFESIIGAIFPPLPQPRVEEDCTTLYVAATNIEPGRVLRPGDYEALPVTQQQLAERTLPPCYVLDEDDLSGRMVREPVPAGAVFPCDAFFPDVLPPPAVARESLLGLAPIRVSSSGTIQVSRVDFTRHLTAPGTRVDVLFRLRFPAETAGRHQPVTYTILEDVQVLAMERDASAAEPDPAAPELMKVILDLSPEQTRQLHVLEDNGDLSLAIRSTSRRTNESLEAELGQALDRLSQLRAVEKTLNEIRSAVAASGVEFDDHGLVEELRLEIAEQEQFVLRLGDELNVSPHGQNGPKVGWQQRGHRTVARDAFLQRNAVAVTVRHSGSDSAADSAYAGAIVDVLFHFYQRGAPADVLPATLTLFEGVEVLAVTPSDDPLSPRVSGARGRHFKATLSVSSEQALKLRVIEGCGELSLRVTSPLKTAQREHLPSPPPAVAGEMPDPLDVIRTQLQEIEIEQQALRRMAEIAARRGVPFAHGARLEKLTDMLKIQHEELEQLQSQASQRQSSPLASGDYAGGPVPPPSPAPSHP